MKLAISESSTSFARSGASRPDLERAPALIFSASSPRPSSRKLNAKRAGAGIRSG
jgi:hypothetical protein